MSKLSLAELLELADRFGLGRADTGALSELAPEADLAGLRRRAARFGAVIR